MTVSRFGTALASNQVTMGAESHEMAVARYNALVTLSAILKGVSANAGHMNGHPLEKKDVRSQLTTWNDTELAYDQETSMGVIFEHIAKPIDAFNRVIPEVATEGCPTIDLTTGPVPNTRDALETIREITYSSIHLRVSRTDPRQLLIEFCPGSMMHTPELCAAYSMFVKISADYASHNPSHFYHGAPREKDFQAACTDGMSAVMTDVFDKQEGLTWKTSTCGELAETLMDKAVAYGRAMGNLNDADVEVLAPLRELMRNRQNSSDIVNERVESMGLVEAMRTLSV